MVKMDSRTGGILALCGGRSFQESPFNRAYRAKRDLGPAYIPFLSAVALERGKVVIPGKPVQTGRQLGIEETIRLSKRLDFTGPFQKTEDLYRGSIAATPIEVAVATSVLANEGEKMKPHFILKITDGSGKILYTYQPESKQAISKDAAKDAYAGIKTTHGKKRLVATTGSRRDAWGIQVDGTQVTVIWLGYDQPQRLGDSKVIEKSTDEMLELLGS
jgi:membrane carboxypeptidase/penicillin-binding protein